MKIISFFLFQLLTLSGNLTSQVSDHGVPGGEDQVSQVVCEPPSLVCVVSVSMPTLLVFVEITLLNIDAATKFTINDSVATGMAGARN